MSNFFDSELVQEEMSEISKLQEKIYSKVFEFAELDRESKLNHINDLEKLMEKQQILYMRMALSDDSDAIEMKKKIQDSAFLMGFTENLDMNLIFSNMGKVIGKLKKELAEETD